MSFKKIRRIGNFRTNNMTAKFDGDWDVEKYRDEHECEEHWLLRKAFMERWKNNYPEERLICLARIFCNVELMGCRYPPLVMQEITHLSYEVAQKYREQRKNKLKRTFVSASVAAGDKIKRIRREAGKIIVQPKVPRINFVPQGNTIDTGNDKDISVSDSTGVAENGTSLHPNDAGLHDNDLQTNNESSDECRNEDDGTKVIGEVDNKAATLIRANEYLTEMVDVKCIDVKQFNEKMFNTEFGKVVLLVRPWARKMENILASTQACGVHLRSTYSDDIYTLSYKGKIIAQAPGTKTESRSIVENLAWEKFRKSVISVLIKEQWVALGETIGHKDVDGQQARKEMFGTPVENSVAIKMMKLMGWQGGGLGSDSQGIAEPIKPNLQMVNRAGLGSERTTDMRALRSWARQLMQRYARSDALDVDLVFSADFSKAERAALHLCAQRAGLASKSYGDGRDRFLVVKKKIDPFTLVRAIVEKGGVTPKHQLYIPAVLQGN